MKYLSLQQAMLGMRVTITDAGLILKSPAGKPTQKVASQLPSPWALNGIAISTAPHNQLVIPKRG